MKKFTLLMFCLMASFALFSQTKYPIPDWNFDQTGSTQWKAQNATLITKLPETNSSGQVVGTLWPVSSPNFLLIQNTASSVGFCFQRFALTGRPDSFSFQAGYFPGSTSEAWGCIVYISKWNTTSNSRDTILFSLIHPNSPGALTPWTAVNLGGLTAVYNKNNINETPDSCLIEFINDIATNSSGQLIATQSTIFVVDNVIFGQQASTGQTFTSIKSNEVTINSVYYSNQNLYLTYSSNEILNHANVSVFDITGRIFYNKDIPVDNVENNSTIIPLNGLKPGIYIVSFTTENGRITKKFVVQ